MSIPERIQPHTLADYFEVMSRAILQAGMRWSMIEAKWPDFRNAFAKFDPDIISRFTAADIERLSNDSRLLRSKPKVQALVANAKRMVDLDNQHGGFANYLHAFGSYEEIAGSIKQNFKYMGDLNVYYFLFRVGEPVPEFEGWLETIPGEHPRMKEMIDLARDQDRQK